MNVFYCSMNRCFFTGRLKIDQSPIMEQLQPVDISSPEVREVEIVAGLMSRHERETAVELLEAAGFVFVDAADAINPQWNTGTWVKPNRVIYSDCRPYDGKEVSEYGRLIELGKDNYSEVETYYTHVKPHELLLVITTRILWGPDGYAAPGNVWVVYWSGEGEPVIQKIRPATHSDYPRDHSVHSARGHKCEICQ